MITHLEFAMPYCLFTIQLLWGYDDDARHYSQEDMCIIGKEEEGLFVGENFIQERIFEGENVHCACAVSRGL